MTFPMNLNFNNGFIPGSSGFGSLGISSPFSAPVGGIFDNTNVNMPFMPVDTFSSSMALSQAEMQNQFFAMLFAMMSNMQINHIPEPFVINNFRPYDYNSFGTNAEKISQLNPKMQEKTMQLLEYAESRGYKVKIKSGYRTPEEQNYLYRTNPNAAKNSLHCKGKAIDIEIAGGTDADYKMLGDYAKSIGMRWGGDFVNPRPERWHFDLGWS